MNVILLQAIAITILLWISIGGLFYPQIENKIFRKVFWFPWKIVDR